jgi:hypothetical protein
MGNRRPCIFTETDVKRFVHAVTAARLEVRGVNLSLAKAPVAAEIQALIAEARGATLQ